MEPWLRHACLVFLMIVLIAYGISTVIAVWQRRH